MQENISLLKLQNRGSVLFVYSDKMHIYVIYHDMEEDRIYRFTCDKNLTVEAAREIEVPEKFLQYREINWYKPTTQTNGCITYAGAVKIDESFHSFKINDLDELTLEVENYQHNSFSLLPMDSLKDIEVDFHIQKSNRLYAIGYNKQTLEQVFVLIDLTQDTALRKYILYSDLGEVIANTINIDRVDGRVYIGGLIRNRETKETIQPYFESFLMPQS